MDYAALSFGKSAQADNQYINKMRGGEKERKLFLSKLLPQRI